MQNGIFNPHLARPRESRVFNMNTKIKVKISGDGTNIGKRLKIVNVTYTYETPC